MYISVSLSHFLYLLKTQIFSQSEWDVLPIKSQAFFFLYHHSNKQKAKGHLQYIFVSEVQEGCLVVVQLVLSTKNKLQLKNK